MASGIYKIANKVTGNIYVGSTINFGKRFSNHRGALNNQRHGNQILQRAYNKYGLENLSFEIIELVSDKNNLIIREQHYLDTLTPKYNICKVASSQLGLKRTEETKLKMSKSQKGKKMSEEAKRKMSEIKKGIIMSEETKKKISMSRKGYKIPEKTKQSIALTMKGNENRSITFKLVSPIGEIIEGKNLAKFCRINNLSKSHFYRVINGDILHYKNWRKAE